MRQQIQKFGRALSGMVMPNIGAFIAWGFVTALFIPSGWWPQHPDGTPGRPDADLPAAVADRLYGRAQRRRRTRRGNRGHCRHGRHRRQRYPDVHRSHGHGPAGRVYDPVVRQTYAGTHKGGLRDAREQFLDRHPRYAAGHTGLLGHRRCGDGADAAGQQRRGGRDPPRTAAARVASGRAVQGAVPQ